MHDNSTPEPKRTSPTLYALTYEHCGAILWTARSVAAVLETQLERLNRYPRFRTGWDHEAYTYDYLAEHDPALLARLREALARFEGRLGVGSCTYGQPLSAFINEESNIRQLTLALETVEKRLGRKLSVYLVSEHAFHAQMPQLLAGCGFQGAVLRTHFMMYGFNPELDAPVAWWVGPDGTRLRCLPTYRGQLHPPIHTGKIPGPATTLDNRILTDAPSEACRLTLAAFRARFAGRIQPLIATRADDPRSTSELIALHEQDDGCQWILAEDIFHILPEPTAELRAGANDFRTRMPWGYCGNWIWNACRAAEALVLTAERLEAISGALGGPDRQAELEAAWKALLVAQHHDVQICGLEDEARSRLGAARANAHAVAQDSLLRVARRIGRQAVERQVFFNPLPWARHEVVPAGADGAQRLLEVPGLGFAAVEQEAEAARPEQTPFEWRPEKAGCAGLRFTRRTQAQGRKARERVDEDVACLTTPHYQAYLARTGGLRLLLDRRTGERLLAPPRTSGTLAALVNGSDCESLGRIVDVTIEPYRAILTEHGGIGPLPYRAQWTFYAHSRRIDWRAEVEFGGQLVGRPKMAVYDEKVLEQVRQAMGDARVVTAFNDHEYKLRLRFYPYLHPEAFGVRDLPFHVAATPGPYVQGIYWTAVSDGRLGLALFNRGQMGSVLENDGAFSSVLAFSLPYVWGQRILSGAYTYDLGILPFTGDWNAANVHRQALEYNFPCLSCRVSALEDALGASWTPYAQSGDSNVTMSAFFRRGGKLFARYYEHAGLPGCISLEWMGRRPKLVEADLREREWGEIRGPLRFEPWRIRTVRYS